MTATSAPFGMRPSNHPSGLARTVSIRCTKTLAEATPTLFQNQPIILDPSGRLAAAVATAGNLILGTFQGVEYTDLNSGRPITTNRWTNGSTVQDNGADSARFYFTRDSDIVYDIQANAAMAAEDLGELGGFSGTSGNATTGFSTAVFDPTTLAAAADQLSVYDLLRLPDNEWTDLFPIIQVQIAQHQVTAVKLGI
jgi:hypothetical protein